MEQILKDLKTWGHDMANKIQVFNGLVLVLEEEVKKAAKLALPKENLGSVTEEGNLEP